MTSATTPKAHVVLTRVEGAGATALFLCVSAVFLVSQGGGGLEVRWLLRLDRVRRFDELRLLRLDRVMGAEYVGFHGVCFPFH